MKESIHWEPPPKPAEAAEQRLVAAILDGQFPINSVLPGERDLAGLLGVTRPTLREALQRLARDGWIEIQHGKATRVRNYWREGNLGVLAAVVQHTEHLPRKFVAQLLQVRELLAPTYTRMAVERASQAVADQLASCPQPEKDGRVFAAFDWTLHQQLTILSGNPVFTLILNGFQELYPLMAERYFSLPETRQSSSHFYQALLACALNGDSLEAEYITSQVMQESLQLWQRLENAVVGHTPSAP